MFLDHINKTLLRKKRFQYYEYLPLYKNNMLLFEAYVKFFILYIIIQK